MQDSIKQLAQNVLRKYPTVSTESQARNRCDRMGRLESVPASRPDRYALWLEQWQPAKEVRVQ